MKMVQKCMKTEDLPERDLRSGRNLLVVPEIFLFLKERILEPRRNSLSFKSPGTRNLQKEKKFTSLKT